MDIQAQGLDLASTGLEEVGGGEGTQPLKRPDLLGVSRSAFKPGLVPTPTPAPAVHLYQT